MDETQRETRASGPTQTGPIPTPGAPGTPPAAAPAGPSPGGCGGECEGGGPGGLARTAAMVAGTGAAVAGGLALAARDTRSRVLGIPLGKRGRIQRAAGSVVDKVTEAARRVGSRFTRD